jgi:O-antigen/teichoic acid export membrane protein
MDNSKIMRNILLVTAISGIIAVLSYLLRSYLAHNYSVGEYGLFYSMVALFTLAVIFVDFGFQQAVVKKASELRAKNKDAEIKNLIFTLFVLQMAAALVISALFFAFSHLIVEHYFHITTTLYFNIMLLWFLTTPITCLIATYFFAYEKTTIWAIFELIKIVYIFGLTIILSHFKIGILSVIIGYASVYLFMLLLFLIFNREMLHISKLRFKFRLIYPATLQYALFIFLNGLLWQLIMQMDTLLLTYLKGIEIVGLYQAAIPLASTLLIAIAPVSSVMLSSIANLWAKGKKAQVKELFLLIEKYLLITLLPITLTFVMFSGLAINIIFGEKFMAAQYALIILSISYMFLAMSNVILYILTALGMARKITRMMMIITGISILYNIVLIYRYDMIGAAVASLITNFAIFMAMTVIVNKKLDAILPIWLWIKTLFLSAVFVLIVYMIKNVTHLNVFVETSLCLAVAGLVYIVMLFLFRLISFKDLILWKKMLKK